MDNVPKPGEEAVALSTRGWEEVTDKLLDEGVVGPGIERHGWARRAIDALLRHLRMRLNHDQSGCRAMDGTIPPMMMMSVTPSTLRCFKLTPFDHRREDLLVLVG